jgi:hypothetical protein
VDAEEAPLPTMGNSADPVRCVFEHWLWANSKNPRRCKLDPARRQAINAMLLLHEQETLELAIEGLAGDPLDGLNDGQRAAMRELEWLLSKSQRVERWADAGEQLRLQAQRMERRRAAQAARPQADELDDMAEREKAALGRARYLELLSQLRLGARHG